MKKQIILLLLVSLFITSCSSGQKYTIDDVEELFEVAFQYEHAGEYKKAIKAYKKVLSIYSEDQPTLNNLAHIYEQMGDYEKSAEYIKQLYVLQPDGFEVIRDTVRILILAGDIENAELALDNFLDKAEDKSVAKDLFDTLRLDIQKAKQS